MNSCECLSSIASVSVWICSRIMCTTFKEREEKGLKMVNFDESFWNRGFSCFESLMPRYGSFQMAILEILEMGFSRIMYSFLNNSRILFPKKEEEKRTKKHSYDGDLNSCHTTRKRNMFHARFTSRICK